jgi:hypothetical protein
MYLDALEGALECGRETAALQPNFSQYLNLKGGSKLPHSKAPSALLKF